MGKPGVTKSSEATTVEQRPSFRDHVNRIPAADLWPSAIQSGIAGALGGDLARVLASCKRTALVVAGLCEELRKHRPGTEELDAMVWAAHRVVEWVAASSRNIAEPALLRYLAEAACANMALRGLAYEYSASRSQRLRLSGLILTQSRKVGALLAQAAELYGRNRARRLRHPR